MSALPTTQLSNYLTTQLSSWRRRRHGFTLIEILIVISIIAILISAASFNYTSARQRSRDAIRKKDLQALKSALLLYWQDQKKFPGEVGRTYASDGTNQWIPQPPGSPLLTPEYIKALPQDPIQTNPPIGDCSSKLNVYCYVLAEDDQNFVLWAQLENKKDNEALDKPGATCNKTRPDETANFNYCLTSPN